MAALPRASIALGMLICVPGASAQQTADEDFRFPNPHPAYAFERGPQVCIDAAHHNYPAERYTPSAALLRGDGYRVRESAQGVAPEVLAACDLLVMVGPIADGNRGDWAFPHLPGFARVELEDPFEWIRAGGRLLFIVGEPRPELPRPAEGPVAGHRHPGVVARGGKEDGERESGVPRRVHRLHCAAGR